MHVDGAAWANLLNWPKPNTRAQIIQQIPRQLFLFQGFQFVINAKPPP